LATLKSYDPLLGGKKMAVPLSTSVSAAGHQVSVFFQSLLVFLLDVLQLALQRFYNTRQTNQATHLGSGTFPPQPLDLDMDGKMAASADAAKKAPVPKIIPALPRIPGRKKENATAKTEPETQLAEGLARLRVDGEDASEQQNKTNKAPTPAPAPETQAIGEASSKSGDRREYAPDEPSQDVRELGPDPSVDEVARAAAVQITNEVSQTSKLKETIRLGDEAIRIPPKAETPEQAAERAIHSGFMREALNMVCVEHMFLFLPLPFLKS
jgi:hypothetical protein